MTRLVDWILGLPTQTLFSPRHRSIIFGILSVNIRFASVAVLLAGLALPEAWAQSQGGSNPGATSGSSSSYSSSSYGSANSPYQQPSVQVYTSFDNPYAPGGIYDPRRSSQTMNGGQAGGGSSGSSLGQRSGPGQRPGSGTASSLHTGTRRSVFQQDDEAAANPPPDSSQQGPGACQSALATSGLSKLEMNRRKSMGLLKSHRTIRASMGCGGKTQASSNSSISTNGFNGGDPDNNLGNGSMNGEDTSLWVKNQLRQLQQMQRVQDPLAQQQQKQ